MKIAMDTDAAGIKPLIHQLAVMLENDRFKFRDPLGDSGEIR